MSVLIGITTSIEHSFYKLSHMYTEAIIKAGGIPILLPPVAARGIEALLKPLDGIILSGGGDIHFDFFNGDYLHPKVHSIYPERDRFELNICRYALENDIKVLGICRGMQIMAISCGGVLIQHLEAGNHNQGDLERNKTFHSVYIREDTVLKDIYKQPKISVNSFHHQAVSFAGDNLYASAYAYDDVIEGIEHVNHPFFVGVQWHPECLFHDCPEHFDLFHNFIML